MGFPHEVVASTIYTTVSEFMRENSSASLEKVVLVAHAKDDKGIKVRFTPVIEQSIVIKFFLK